jgi:Flp pilus assembly protein TadG
MGGSLSGVRSVMLRRLRPRRHRTRGQGLVEFAIVAPVLLLILLAAIDFGRLYFGYVILQNASRIAANYAAQNPTADFGSGSRYEQLVTSDTNGANCQLVGGVPSPTFTDSNDNGSPDTNHDVGDDVSVSLQCNFSVLTPIVSAVTGGTIPLTASTEFQVRDGRIVGAPTQPPVSIGPVPTGSPSASPTGTAGACPGGQAVVPDLVNPSPETVDAARTEWSDAGFTGPFSPANGQNNKTVLTQTLTAGSCQSTSSGISVTHS